MPTCIYLQFGIPIQTYLNMKKESKKSKGNNLEFGLNRASKVLVEKVARRSRLKKVECRCHTLSVFVRHSIHTLINGRSTTQQGCGIKSPLITWMRSLYYTPTFSSPLHSLSSPLHPLSSPLHPF
jgi:hypothetical protein